MTPAPLVVLVPSMAAAVELPRRLASLGRALTGIYLFTVPDLARSLAEPSLLGRGLQAWNAGHAALLASRLLEGPHRLPLGPERPHPRVAAALARTLSSLRLSGLPPAALEDAAGTAGATTEDGARLRALASLYRAFHAAVEGHFADPATLTEAARKAAATAGWLEGAEVLVVDDLDLEPLEKDLLAGLARERRVRFVARQQPPGLAASSFASWASGCGMEPLPAADSPFASLELFDVPPGLSRLRGTLFEPPGGEPCLDGSVELLTAPGEEAEVRSVVRRLLRAAGRGVSFEEMGVILPRPNEYAPLFTDLLGRLGIPHRLHPSLPLSFGRCARSLMLALRCRGLQRGAVMEFLTFAPIRFEELLGAGAVGQPALWDAISREAGIVSGLERWIIGLRALSEDETQAAAEEAAPALRERRLSRASEAEALLRVVELLSSTLDGLAGEASWPEWSERLRQIIDTWIERGDDREALEEVVADLAGLGSVGGGRRAGWSEVETVLEARLEWNRLPMRLLPGGAVHVGATDALAGVPFRVVAIPGLVEGGFPGVLRPDPFLLDPEREALSRWGGIEPRSGRQARRVRSGPEQLALFGEVDPPAPGSRRLPTTQDRLLDARRLFLRAVRQAGESLILSYPRADARTGRERMPSLFFVAAASALAGAPVSAQALERLVSEDDPSALPLDDTLDRSERDLLRVRTGGRPAAEAVAAGSPFFRQSRLASEARWSPELTAYDGLLAYPATGDAEAAAALREALDPVRAARPISASRLATFSRCGFQYLLEYVLRLEPRIEPEERKKLDPLERGSLFHEVAERFLRERRDRGKLPVADTPLERERLLSLADASLDALVAGSPPRYTALWERERGRFRQGLLAWLSREAATASRATPAHFELAFGLPPQAETREPHSPDPLEIELGDGRVLRVCGKIDRIDRRPDGTLSLRDYKTGRAPRDDGGVFRGGRQLQIPFYILAAAKLFPDAPVVEAFLDYVDGGRRVAVGPEAVRSPAFGTLLRGLVDAIAQGIFVQEPASCDFCDFTSVCGPKPLIQWRRRLKRTDPRLNGVLRLREIG